MLRGARGPIGGSSEAIGCRLVKLVHLVARASGGGAVSAHRRHGLPLLWARQVPFVATAHLSIHGIRARKHPIRGF